MTTHDSTSWVAVHAGRAAVCRPSVIQRARLRLASHGPCAYYFRDIRMEHRQGVLTLYGCVPTYALRSLLESILSEVEGVALVDNRVNVINPSGLSCVRRTAGAMRS